MSRKRPYGQGRGSHFMAEESDERPSGVHGNGVFRRNNYRKKSNGPRRGSNFMTGESHEDTERPPPGLRGKEIGLFYKNRDYKKKLNAQREKSNLKTEPDDNSDTSENKKKCTDEPIQSIQPFRGVYIKLPMKTIEQIRQLLTSCSFVDRHEQNVSYNHIADSTFKTNFLKTINSSFEEKLIIGSHKKEEPKPELDTKYYEELKQKENTNSNYQSFLKYRMNLPSYEKRDEILKLVRENQVIVISGETGCGKTTQVPQFILDDYILSKNGSKCKIVCTQPRRISAISIAERVAQERGEKCGASSVGYQIRLEKKLPRFSGSIVYCTTGVLLKQMESDPYLSEISHLILDEIHERDVISDFLITLLKQVIERRKDLKLILMSATMNSEHFAKYYNNCALIEIPGFTYPVEEYYLEDVLNTIKFDFEPVIMKTGWRKHLKGNKEQANKDFEFRSFIEPYIRNLSMSKLYHPKVCYNLRNPNSEKLNTKLIYELIVNICKNEKPGAILVFLPGFLDISNLHKILKEDPFFSYNHLIIPLHSKLPTIEQKAIFDEPPKGVRKIVIATNIAETSITINDVVYVIDSGKIKLKDYDVERNIESLEAQWVSSANANQRRGRAGRVKPGKCYHLFSKARNMVLDKYTSPEILRMRLEGVILSIKILQLGKVEEFLNRVMDPPNPTAVKRALVSLERMNALDSNEQLTPLGYHLAKLPMNPQMGKMALLAGLFSCLDPILGIAASLDFKDAFLMPIGKENEVLQKKMVLLDGWKSDHLVLYEALNRYEKAKAAGSGRKFCWDFFLSSFTLDLLINMKKQFAEYLHEMKFIANNHVKNDQWNKNSQNYSLIKAIICAGLYPNVAVIKKQRKYGKNIRTLENESVGLFMSSVNCKDNYFQSPFLVYYSKLKTTKIYLHDTTMVHVLPLLFFGDKFKIEHENEHTMISSDTLKFKCDENTALLIRDLRFKLDELLEYKVSHPGIVDWSNSEDKEVRLLRAIKELITTEDIGNIEYSSDEETF